MAVLWYGFVLAIALGMAVWFGLAMHRIPRCQYCRVPAIALTYQLAGTSPPIFELVYRCPRCRQLLSKRFVNALCD
jgi:hypothetical protein